MRLVGSKAGGIGIGVVLLLAYLSTAASEAMAERLPIKTYTTADGLARDYISRIVQDSRGFLWFCTTEGLSRFDGYGFTNYGREQGLQGLRINDLLESRSGIYWIATSEGLYRFNPEPAPQARGGVLDRSQRFAVYYPGDTPKSRYIRVLCEDRAGTIWCGTEEGLYRLDRIDGQWAFSFADIVRPEKQLEDSMVVQAILEDRRGALWITTRTRLYRRSADNVSATYGAKEGLPVTFMTSLLEDNSGRIWVGTRVGLCQLVPDPEPNQPAVARAYTSKEGLARQDVTSLLQSSDGRVWAGAIGGLSEFRPAAIGAVRFQDFTSANGLADVAITALAEDRDGNLWIGTEAGGAMKLTLNGFTSYGETDGLGGIRIGSIFENRAGELCVISGDGFISRLGGRKFSAVPLTLPKGISYRGWGWYQVMFQDSQGEWWMNTGGGLVRYPKLNSFEQLKSARPKVVYTTRDGLLGNLIFRLFEDSRGDIWISTINYGQDGLTRWERASGAFHRYSPSDGVFNSAPSAFCEDASGNLWIGFYDGGLLRYAAGRFTPFGQADGLPAGLIRGLFSDRVDRLWVATAEGGVARIDNPGDERPRFVTYTTADGLSSNQATCVTEDKGGRIYIGTGRGVNRLDPATGHITQYTTADGLANNFINVSFCDRYGTLWFGTLKGLSRLDPQPERPTPPPPILISALSIAGVSHPVSALGATEIVTPELRAGQNKIRIDFVGLSLAAGESLHYQYKLEGANDDWSAPTDQRTVNYPNLSPGAYRFLVRAIGAGGSLSQLPATVRFRILSPIWRQWWFVTISALIIASAVLAFARTRYERLKALRESENRFRTLAETASDAIITIDEDSRIVLVNNAAERIFGYTIAEMLGADLTMLMPEYLRHLHQAGFGRYKRTGNRHISWKAIELPGMHKNGSEIPLELSFGEFIRNDRRYFTGIARDITERKRAEEALRQSREERLAELERVRRRIATDLHDDIGSSLTQISLLSEVMRTRVDSKDSRLAEPLSMIASTSRELVDSMSDIVWAINPQKDQLSDLTLRMRRFASDVFTARNIDFRLREPDEDQDIRLGANIRREIFLIFKESINNMVRHSGCTEADLEFKVAGERLMMRICDNGNGFDLSLAAEGHGLASMRERAMGIGGKLEITSNGGVGTTVSLTLPLGRPD